MSFFYFAPNVFSLMQNLQISQSFDSPLSYVLNPFTQPFYEIYSWGDRVPTETFSIPQKDSSLLNCPTHDNYNESEVIIAVPEKKNCKNQKKKQGKEKQVSSAKKNSQSNIINQLFSFFGSKQKSEQLVFQIIKVVLPESKNHQKILALFYNTFRAINIQRGRKYVNRNVILNYFTPEIMSQNLPEVNDKISESGLLSLDQLCSILRRCCHSFLRDISKCAILTSKRITGISKEHHLKKRRKVLKSILQY